MRRLVVVIFRLALLSLSLVVMLGVVAGTRSPHPIAAASDSELTTGSVSGVVAYTGSLTGTIVVRLMLLPDATPYSTTLFPPGGPYTITGVPDGIYTCFGFLDVNGSRWPDYGEPQSVYQGQFPITVSGGAVSGIDVWLDDTIKGRIIGAVDIQAREKDDSDVNVNIAGITRPSRASGYFMRLLPMSETYAVTLSLPGYLSTWRQVPLTAYERYISTITHPIILLGGDADHDDDIDIADLVLLGANFGGSGGDADINGSGAVNIFDIVMVGANFGRHAPTPWPPLPPAPPAPPP